MTVIVPFKRGGRRDWLDEAVASIPAGTPYLIAENDGELADALNQAVQQADTEYVVRLDADDLLDPDSVQALVDACWDVDVCYPSMLLVTENLELLGRHESGVFCPNRLQVHNYIPGAGSVVRRSALTRVGGYRDLEALEDWDLWVRMSRAGSRFKWHPEASYFYRQVAGSRNKLPPARARALTRDIVGAKPGLAATFYAQETVATTYWRCSLPALHMPGQVVPHRPQVQVDGDEIGFPHHRGVAVWQFPGNHYERFSMAAMQEQGVPCLVETDDNYLVRSPHRSHWVNAAPGRGEENTRPSHEMHRKIVAWCDGVIVTTEHLARQYRKFTDAPVFVCPNQIEPGDWDTEVSLPDWYDPDKTYVGVTGSASHGPDVRLTGRALEWAARQPGVEVVLFGPAGVYRRLADRLRFRHVPWTTDLAVYRALQRVLDIGLAPVVENAWSVCRSDVKALEYLMSGAVPVLSEAVPYRGWADGEYCRKADGPAGFLEAVRDLVRDPVLRRDLAAEGRAHVLGERTVGRNVWRWAEACATPLREAIAA